MLFPLAVLFGIELLDQATQSAFNVLTPNMRDAFGLTNAGILLIVAIAGAAALACTLPVAVLADRSTGTIALVGALVGAGFSIGLGLSDGVVLATVMLAGISMGQAVIFPTHNSLLADYFPVPARPRIYSAHRSASAWRHHRRPARRRVGRHLVWRAPFFVFAVPIVVVVVIGLRLREPPRGRHEQEQLAQQMLASERGEPAALDDPARRPRLGAPVEPPPSLGEAWRTVWKIGVLRRIFFALPFLAAAIAGFTSLASLQYQETFHLDALHRAYLIAPIQVFDLLGLAVGAMVATRLASRESASSSACSLSPPSSPRLSPSSSRWPQRASGLHRQRRHRLSLAIVGPGVLASLSLAIPARVRSVGFSIGALFVLPGFLVLPGRRRHGRRGGFRYGLLILVPIFIIGGLIVASAGSLIARDVENVWISMRTRTQMLSGPPRDGRLPLLAVRGLSVGYDGVTVLGDVDIEIGESEIVALLGTNGAGKSTLLRAIGGVVEADHGAIVFDGRDITHLPPDEIAGWASRRCPAGTASSRTCASRRTCAPRAVAGPPAGRARRRHDPRGADGLPLAGLAPAVSGRRTSRAASSRCSRSPWRPSPARSCSSSTSSRSGSPRWWSNNCWEPSSRCARPAPPSCSSSSR